MSRTTSKTNLSVLAKNLRALRTSRGMRQEDLARAAKIARGTVAGIELDRYSSTDTATIIALARALDVSANELLGIATASSGSYVEAFLASPWAQAVGVKVEEISWLRSVPEIVWSGSPPDPYAISKLILWRREKNRDNA